MNKESFLEVGWVNEVKVKLCMGEEGNDNVGDFG